MRTLLLFPFLNLFFFNLAFAEYRVFNLQISKSTGEVRNVQSTLDPEQYRGYNTVTVDEKIQYTETWMCRGRTDGGLDFCPNPQKAQIPAPLESSAPAP